MAEDTYDRHYAEKLWSLVPSHHRDLDGREPTSTDPGGRNQLRALVDAIGVQAAALRRSADRTWEDQFIDSCDDWAVPYIGDLVATRMLSALDTRARRVDVAKTVYYRRRKGTLRVMEELIGDITGWEGVVVEQFRRLGRTWHALDEEPTERLGRLTSAPRGGTADLRSPFGAELAHGAFSEYSYTADVRRHRGKDGWRGITKVGFHLYRLRSVPVYSMRPTWVTGTPRAYTFDPLGRDVPLYAAASRPEFWEDWRSLRPWEVPAPITCRMLNHAIYDVTPEAVATVSGAGLGLTVAERADLATLRGRWFASTGALHRALAATASGAALTAPAVRQALEATSIIEDCGKWRLFHGSIAVTDAAGSIPPEAIIAGDLSTWREPPAGYRAMIDPERGRIRFRDAQAGPRADIRIGVVGAVGAHPLPSGRRPDATDSITSGGNLPTLIAGSVTAIEDSYNYRNPVGATVIPTSLTLQAAPGERPYVALRNDWVFDSGLATDVDLVLDGLWIGGGHDVVLRGDFASVVLRRCTLDANTLAPGDGVRLVVEGNVGSLTIERSLVGPVVIDDAAIVATLKVTDSVVESDDPTDPGAAAVVAGRTTVDLRGVTSMGSITARRLWADDTLAVGRVRVADTQSGCFRFSAAPPGSRLPHPYESTVTPSGALFTTRDPGQPAYAQLRQGLADAIARGAEDGSELGAFAHLRDPISFDSLQIKIGEYLPFGLAPYFVFAT